MKVHLLPAIIVCGFLNTALGFNPPGHDQPCKDAVVTMTNAQLKNTAECITELNFKDVKERSEKMSCVMKCVLMRTGVIGSDGHADVDGVLKFISLNFPDHIQEWAQTVIMSCQDHITDLKPEEENCRSYQPIVKCIMGLLGKICSPPK